MRAAIQAAAAEIESDALGHEANEALLIGDRECVLVEGIRGLARRALQPVKQPLQARAKRLEHALHIGCVQAGFIVIAQRIPRFAALLPAKTLRLLTVQLHRALEPRLELREVTRLARRGPRMHRLAREFGQFTHQCLGKLGRLVPVALDLAHIHAIGMLFRKCRALGLGGGDQVAHLGAGEGLMRQTSQMRELRGSQLHTALGHHGLLIPAKHGGAALDELHLARLGRHGGVGLARNGCRRRRLRDRHLAPCVWAMAGCSFRSSSRYFSTSARLPSERLRA